MPDTWKHRETGELFHKLGPAYFYRGGLNETMDLRPSMDLFVCGGKYVIMSKQVQDIILEPHTHA